MADEADRAAPEIDALLAEQIRLSGIKNREEKPFGYCRYCMEPVAANALYCDADCESDCKKEHEQLRRMGKMG